MVSLLLAIIYIAFISLGLPDSLLGSAWPVMYGQLGVPLSYAGIVTMLIAGGTIVSSLLSDRLTRRFGAGLVTACSVMLTAVALLGFSFANSFILLCVFAIPYGLGAGAVDAALNNYVALHYQSRHMNWLHCFWGVGASISPYIMSAALTGSIGWHGGYRNVAILQLILSAILFASLPMWKHRKGNQSMDNDAPAPAKPMKEVLQIKGVPFVLLTFLAYCALESTTGVWATSFLVNQRGIDTQTAAKFCSLFFLGITVGRFISGLIADRFGDQQMTRVGIGIMGVGVGMLFLPLQTDVVALAGLIVIGLGGAPVYPCLIHATPDHFGEENSQAIIGMQMASAYTGSTFAPVLFGFLGDNISMGFFAPYLLLFVVVMLVASEKLSRLTAHA